MNLALSEDQVMIRDSAQGFLADASAPAAVRAAMATPAGFDDSLWQRIGGELGWCGTAIAEEHGGLGLGPVELALIVEQMGRRLVCAPFFASVCLAANVLTEAGSKAAQHQHLPGLAAGRLRATAALDTNVTAKKDKKGWILDGTAATVVDGASAELILVAAKAAPTKKIQKPGVGAPAGAMLFAVPADAKGLTRPPLTTWDATRRVANLTLRNVVADRIDDPARRDGIARATALARLYLAAEQLGGAQQCLDLAVAHTVERKQFGRPIASFQAVKHRCAAMMVQVEALRSAVYGAAALAASRPALDELERECAMVKALAADAAFQCAQEAIQLHGGVGFTWEYEPHLYFKRAQATSHWLGSASAMCESVAQSLLDR